ncbi:hypothetical protein FKM82_014945 [Ascaphus truei]
MWHCACFLVVVQWVVENLGDSGNVTTTSAPTQNATSTVAPHLKGQIFGFDVATLQRAFYVLIGVSLLAVLYFIIRTMRLKKKPQRKKYGLLSDYDENMEMGSLDSDEEKIFEARNIRR